MNPILSIASLFATSVAGTAANLQAIVDDMREAQDIPGVSAIVLHRNDVLYSGASGMADIAAQRPMTPETVLYVGSLSKIFTAVLTLNLVEAGELGLADTLDGIAIDADGASAPVSITHILTHASGIPREGNFDYWFTADFPDSTELRDYLRSARLRAPPGRDLHYSNVAYSALGPIIEDATGMTYADALRTLVLQPLRMRSSGATSPNDNIANAYTGPGRLIPSEEKPFAGVGDTVGDRRTRMYHDARAMTPAFGIHSSAQEMGRLARFLMGYGGDDVLSEHMRDRMRERQASGWGLGLKVQRYKGHHIARHDGWFAAHKAHMLLDIRHGVAVVVMTNGDNASPKAIAEALFDQALKEVQ